MDATTRVPRKELSPPPIAWIGLGILVLLAFVSFLDRQIIALMVSPIERNLRISDTQIGLLQGPAFGLAYPIIAIPFGYAADRYSRRWVIFWSVIFWSLSAMYSGLAHSFSVLFAARVGVALGEAALGPATASLLSDIFPKHRLATVFSIYGSGSILGQAGALAVGGAVISWAKSGLDVPWLGHLAAWQIAFILTGVPAAMLAWLIFIVPEPRRAFQSPSSGAAAQPRWSEVFDFMRQTWAYLVCYVVGQSLLIMVGAGVWTWLPVAMERSFGWTAVKIGSAVGLFTAAFGFTGQLANGVMVDRMFRTHDDAHLRYYMFAAAVVTVSGCLAPLVPNPWIYLAILGPMKFLMNFSGVFAAALQVATPSRLRGRITALAAAVTSLVGWTLGPTIVPYFTDNLFHDPCKTIWSIALLTGIFMPIAGVLFALGLRPMGVAVRRQRA
jgi:MFS family permease